MWASGLEISTANAVSDADMSEYRAAETTLDEAVSIPVVVGCDTGFGNSNHMISEEKV